MSENWFTQLANLKLSLPNVAFFIFLIMGGIIWKLYSDLAKLQGKKDLFTILRGLIGDLLGDDTSYESRSLFTHELNNEQKDFSVKPIEFRSLRHEAHNSVLPQTEQSLPSEIKEEKSKNFPETSHFQEAHRDTTSNTFNPPAKRELPVEPSPELPRTITSHYFPPEETTSGQALARLSNRNNINILKKVSLAPPEPDFGGYLALQETPSIEDSNEEKEENPGNQVFFPPIEVKGSSIPRFKQIAALKRSIENNEVLFLIGPPSLGKTYLVSLLARELKYADTRSIISFTFSQNINSLADATRLILSEQLKVPALSIENPIQSFFKLISRQNFLVLFNNVEFLPSSDLMILYNCNLGMSKAILLSSSLSTKSLCQHNTLSKSSIIELQEIESEIVQNYFLERVPRAFHVNPLLMNKIIRFVRGNPLILVLLCAFIDQEFKKNSEANLEDIFKQIDNVRVISDKSIPINLCKMLNLTLGQLNNTSKDVLLFCSYLPLQSFSSSMIESIFEMHPSQGIEVLESLNTLGLIQRLSGESSQNPHYSVHQSIKDYVYKEFRIEDSYLSQLVNRIIVFYVNLLNDQNKLQKENSIFVISGLIYSLKIISSSGKSSPQFNSLFEKAVAYLNELGLNVQIENNILPIYEENLNNAYSQDDKAFWLRLLGMAFILLSGSRGVQQEKIELLQKGIEMLSTSLSLYSSLFSTHQTRQLHNDLGNAYINLAEICEPESNLINAVDNFKKAIQVQGNVTHELDYLQSHINLGHAYLRLYKLKPTVITIQLAVQILAKVAASLKENIPSQTRSFVHQNLGNAYRSLASHEEPISNLQAAITEYQAALDGAETSKKALLFNSLGCCFWKLAKYHNPTHNLELAISSYKKALSFLSNNWNPLSQTQYSPEVAVTQNNLGTSYKTLASLKNPEANLSSALKCFKEALSIAEKVGDNNLRKVVNQHLFELSNLVDGIISHKPDKKDHLQRFKQSMNQDFFEDIAN